MKGLPTKVGAQPKQVAVLSVLLVVLVVIYLLNRKPSIPSSAASPPPGLAAAAPVAARLPDSRRTQQRFQPGPLVAQRGPARGASTLEDFHPSLKLKEGMDVSRIDPTLRLDLLAKLQQAPMEGGARSIFEFSKPPAPPPPKVAPIKPGPLGGATVKPAADPKAAPAAPALPLIPLKYYGYANGPRGAVKQAFFLDGDDIFVAGENELIHNRYKIISIGVNSAVVEDTTNKKQQTLRLVEELAG